MDCAPVGCSRWGVATWVVVLSRAIWEETGKRLKEAVCSHTGYVLLLCSRSLWEKSLFWEEVGKNTHIQIH